MKVRHKITLAGVLAAIIPVLIAISVIMWDVVIAENRKATQIVQGYIAIIASRLSSFFDNARTTATALATLQSDLQLSWDDAEKIFNQIFYANNTIDRIAFVDSDAHIYETGQQGNVWQGGRRTENDFLPDSQPISVADTDYFQALVSNNIAARFSVLVSEPSLISGSGRKSITTSAPIIHEGRAVGLVSVRQSASYLARIYTNLFNDFSVAELFGLNSHFYLISDGGQLLSSGSYSHEKGVYEDSLLNSTEIVSSSTLGSETLEAFNAALIRSSVIQNINGEPHFVAAMRVEGVPLAVCMIVPQGYMATTATRILTHGAIIFFIVSVAACVAAAVFSGPIMKSLVAMSSAMQGIAEGGGDLTVRFDAGGKDEIAEMCKNFNQFVGTLNEMISNVSSSAFAMDSVSQTLSKSVEEISLYVSKITTDIDDMHLAVEEQSSALTETSSTITQIAQTIESLSNQIESQSTAVAQSSSAVHQMLSNINTISSNLSRASSSFADLKTDASAGRESIGNVQELVLNLSRQSDSILEANEVINSIANQTNLLAMNAAIEAAHAGDAGRGFTVVADEIRKLAEDSAEQSRTIAYGLKEAVTAIDNIANATSIADSAFDSVASRIEAVTALVSAISFSMSEQNAGSRQVIDGLTNIENITAKIRSDAIEMNSSTSAILNGMGRLAGVSRHVQDRSTSIAGAADTINGAVAKIIVNSNTNSSAIDILVDITSKFKL